ncbi:MAG: hypothetical protein FWB93_02610 [Oscillospiraceae bacterium]|nr:hypothetical protein [Oscillospiraceae bacterium]
MKKLMYLLLSVTIFLAIGYASSAYSVDNDAYTTPTYQDNNDPPTPPPDPNWLMWGVYGGMIVAACFGGFVFVASGWQRKSKDNNEELDEIE